MSVALLGAMLVSQGRSAEAFGNLVRNPGFEAGDSRFWGPLNSAVVSDNARTGTKAGKLLAGGEANFEQRVDGLVPNTRYTLSGFAKTDSLDVRIGVKRHGNTETNTSITATSYTKGVVTFTTGPDSRSAVIYVFKPDAVNTAYADDFTLVPSASLPDELLTNGGFESGSASWWTFDGSVGSGNARSGTQAARLSGGEGTFEQAVSLSANTTYTFSGYAKTDAHEVRIGVKAHGNTEMNVKLTSATYAKGAVTFTTGPRSTSAIVYFFKPTTGNTAYGDDFTLTPTPAGVPEVWTEHSLTSVFPDTRRTDASGSAVDLVAARNDYESGQIVLRSEGAFDITSVTLPDLVNGTARIPSSQLRYKFVDYIYLARNSHFQGPIQNPLRVAPGYYPEYLLNERTKSVLGNTTQSISITVYVPKGTGPGLYTGTVNIATTAGSRTVPVKVEVADVEIPDSANGELSYANYTTLFGFQGEPDQVPLFYPGMVKYSDEWFALMRKFAADFKEHRMNSHWIPTIDLLFDGGSKVAADGTVTFNWSRFDQVVELLIAQEAVKRLIGDNFLNKTGTNHDTYAVWGLKNVNGTTVRATLPFETSEAQTFGKTFIRELRAHLVARGWWGMWWQTVGDEPFSAQHLEAWRRTYDEILEPNAPGIKTSTPHNTPANQHTEVFEDRLDVFVPMLRTYTEAQSYYQRRQELGDEVWTYICNLPTGGFYNRFIDLPLARLRFMNWYNFANGVTGTLHWAYNYWINPPETIEVPGDTSIVYPDPVNGTFRGTLRHDAMRDGIEDYELLAILAARDPAAARKLVTAVAPTATDASVDNEYLAAKHRQLVRAAAGQPVADPRVSAFDRIEAENVSDHDGSCRTNAADVDGAQAVCGNLDGRYVGYDQVDFGPGGSLRFDLRVASAVGAATMGVWIGGKLTTTVPLPNTGGWQTWQTVRVPVTTPSGTHRLEFRFNGQGGTPLVHLNWFKFTPTSGNLARDAVATASSEHSSQYAAVKVQDDITHETDVGEWASAGEQNPWMELRWSSSRTIDQVVLFDRINPYDDVNSGLLSFSDGTSIQVTGIRDDGDGRVVSFPAKTVSWLRFQVTGGTGPNVGLSEVQAALTP